MIEIQHQVPGRDNNWISSWNLYWSIMRRGRSSNNNNFTATDNDVDGNDSKVKPECIEEFLEL